MYKHSKTGLHERRKAVTSFLVLTVLIGSAISSVGLMGLTISPQYAWAGIPAQVTLSSPANGVIIGTTTPTLTWDRIGGNPANQPQTTNGYRILIDNELTFSAPFTELFQNHPSSGATVSIVAPTLTLGTTYSWKVQGINADGSATFSAVRTFTVALPAPGLLTPELVPQKPLTKPRHLLGML